MNWGEIFSSDNLIELALPVGIGLVIIIVLIFLRRLLDKYVRKLSSRTTNKFGDIMVRDTNLATLLWCIWLGIFSGFTIYRAPASWAVVTDKVIPVLFTALGIYTLTMVVVAVLKWYRYTVCPRTSTRLDDIIMLVLVIGTPIVSSLLGIILILNMLGYENSSINGWLSENLGSLAFLIIVGVLLLLLTILFVPRIIQALVRNSKSEQTEDEMKKRADTLVGVITTTLQITILFILALMIVGQVVSWTAITPILTATGVVGIAIGFGAQSLVRDVLAGIFIIMENQYRKGDVVKIADTSGVVEEINLRRTILRDLDGITHVVPNGEIRVSSNFTKQWSRANFNISVAYSTDLDKAMAVINRVGKEMAEDPAWSPALLSAPRALRVDKLGDSGIEIKVLAETKPVRQWEVMGELRLRLKKAFDQEGIEIPWPHTKVYFGNQPPAVWSEKIEMTSTEEKKPAQKLNN